MAQTTWASLCQKSHLWVQPRFITLSLDFPARYRHKEEQKHDTQVSLCIGRNSRAWQPVIRHRCFRQGRRPWWRWWWTWRWRGWELARVGGPSGGGGHRRWVWVSTLWGERRWRRPP